MLQPLRVTAPGRKDAAMSSTQMPEQTAWVRRVLGVDPAAGRDADATGAGGGTLYVKSRTAWIATRAKVESELAKLHGALTSAYQGHAAAEPVEKAFQTRVQTLLNTLDDSLAKKLDEVNQATDAGQRAQLVQQARQIMLRYGAYVAGEPFIAKLDANPIVPVAIGKTLLATLTALSKAVR
jgi:hypothetical protein